LTVIDMQNDVVAPGAPCDVPDGRAMLPTLGPVPGRTALICPAGPAIPRRGAVRQGVALSVLLLVLLGLHPALPAAALPFGAAPPPPHAPLATRVRYIHMLVADAEYALATTPRVYSVWRWQVAVLPAQPDPQAAWDAIRRIAPVAFDQPEVPSLLWHIQLNLQLTAQTASLAQQLHEVYTPDYTPVRNLLDLLDTDVAAALAPPSPAASDRGTCPLCAVP
jgi:hypothetical protein